MNQTHRIMYALFFFSQARVPRIAANMSVYHISFVMARGSEQTDIETRPRRWYTQWNSTLFDASRVHISLQHISIYAQHTHIYIRYCCYCYSAVCQLQTNDVDGMPWAREPMSVHGAHSSPMPLSHILWRLKNETRISCCSLSLTALGRWHRCVIPTAQSSQIIGMR